MFLNFYLTSPHVSYRHVYLKTVQFTMSKLVNKAFWGQFYISI